MSISALQGSSASTSKLVKLVSGEYTAASVNADPAAATKLNLFREKDGNYGIAPPTPIPAGSAVTKSSAKVLASLDALRFGGA